MRSVHLQNDKPVKTSHHSRFTGKVTHLSKFQVHIAFTNQQKEKQLILSANESHAHMPPFWF